MSAKKRELVTYKFRLCDKHAAELDRQARAVNLVWNYCNETQQKAARSGRKWLTWIDLKKLTAGSSKELNLHGHTIQQVCIYYDRSRLIKRKAWLRWRCKKSLGWVPFGQGAVSIVASKKFKFRGIIYEAMHWRDLPQGAMIRAGSFNQDAKGRWYINIPVEVPAEEQNSKNTAIGIDLGLRNLVTLSNGRKIETPRFYRKSEEAIATAQRARKTKRVRSIHRKSANWRKDFMHKLSAQISKEYGLIVVGDVSPSKLAQTKLAKSIHDAGWSDLKFALSYKTHLRGGRFLEVSEHMTTQLCSSCGALPPERPRGIAQLRIREWTCGDCGATHDRDVNAARNILARGLASLEEGAAKERSSQRRIIR